MPTHPSGKPKLGAPNEKSRTVFFPLSSKNFLNNRKKTLQVLFRAKCGKFRLPFTLKDRLVLLREIFFLKDADEPPIQSKWPAEPEFVAWRMLLKYLHREKIVSSSEVPVPYVYNDMPRIFEASLSFELGDKTDSPLTHWSGHGNSRDFTIALSKALGETLERYFLLRFKKKNLLKEKFTELKRRKMHVIDLFDVPGFMDWQRKKFPRFGFLPDSPLRWVRGEQIDSRMNSKETYIPAQMAFWGYRSDEPTDEQILGLSTTNGAGAYFSREGAILSGLHELIQRDAFMIHWLQRMTPTMIDLATIDEEELRGLIHDLKRYRYELVLLNTSLDFPVSSVAAVIIDRTKTDATFSVGGGSGFSLAHAIRQAIYEALSISTLLRDGEIMQLPNDYEPFLTPGINKRERIRLWRGKEAEARIAFLFQGEKISYDNAKKFDRKFKNQREELKYLLNIFESKGKGYEVYVYEVDDPILRKIGYHVVRTIVPRLFPIYLTEHHAPLNSKRLRDIPLEMGYPISKELNPWPHPFP